MKIAIKALLIGTVAAAGAFLVSHKIATAADKSDYEMEHVHWHFNGWNGTFDRAAVQRGFQVYKEVCASCHELKFMSFRHLGDKGGPFYHEDYANPIDNPWVKEAADKWPIPVNSINIDTGAEEERAAIPADEFPSPYANAIQAAASNNAKAPPELSVMAKARPAGADHIYNFLMSYDKDDNRFNHYLGSQVAMPDQIWDDRVEYEVLTITDKDGNVTEIQPPAATKEQIAKDVTEFLAWAADPKMETRKSLGVSVMIYLLILAILLFLSYRQVWRNVKH